MLLALVAWLYPQLCFPGLPKFETGNLVVFAAEGELKLFEALEF